MHHHPITGSLTTEELAFSLDAGTAEPKMGSAYLLHTAAQAALAMGLCGIANLIAG